jgi:hypothetical protein
MNRDPVGAVPGRQPPSHEPRSRTGRLGFASRSCRRRWRSSDGAYFGAYLAWWSESESIDAEGLWGAPGLEPLVALDPAEQDQQDAERDYEATAPGDPCVSRADEICRRERQQRDGEQHDQRARSDG